MKKNSSKKKTIRRFNQLFSNRLIIISAIVVILLSLFFLIHFTISNPIIRTKGIKIYYRTYTKEKGWTRWSQNGQVNGNKYPIRKIQIKVKSNYVGNVFYNTRSNKKWMINDVSSGKTSGNSKYPIDTIRVMLSDTLYKKYELRYRIKYGEQWTEWYRNYYKLRSNEPIENIQIEVIEKKVN